MAATDQQDFNLGLDQSFIQRVTAAILAYAYTVETELNTVASHAARLTLANKVVLSPDVYAIEFSRLLAAVDSTAQTQYVSTTPAASANVTDAQIATDVATGWNLIAGV